MLTPIEQLTDEQLRREWAERLNMPGAATTEYANPLKNANVALAGFQQATARIASLPEYHESPAMSLLNIIAREYDEWPETLACSLEMLLSGDVCRRLVVATVQALRGMEASNGK